MHRWRWSPITASTLLKEISKTEEGRKEERKRGETKEEMEELDPKEKEKKNTQKRPLWEFSSLLEIFPTCL